jgi:hypothetical protein
MGAQVGWDRAREKAPPVETDCPMCGARGYWTVVDDPDEPGHERTVWVQTAAPIVREGSATVCAKCHAWGLDRKVAEAIEDDYAARGHCGPVAVHPEEP